MYFLRESIHSQLASLQRHLEAVHHIYLSVVVIEIVSPVIDLDLTVESSPINRRILRSASLYCPRRSDKVLMVKVMVVAIVPAVVNSPRTSIDAYQGVSKGVHAGRNDFIDLPTSCTSSAAQILPPLASVVPVCRYNLA